ncbi:4-carboxymuconolactone decarboxylase [Aspergillus sclerotiicarbonarius CBS 121057]|uniref:4-carboxymuconolactone decarboxylase n=1 Tax=Aspergillus sclerotiicarbonarius (strain CBS 121057 / IBT 28362) TaxID=1448318 RepID=A0A319DZH6_ASPSB|nr:4-carboxymuconolactone decarboxylase [Aspergillus sclerotiicarbonarius CBS 121057]
MAEKPELKPLHDALFKEGLKIRRAVVGDAYVNRSLANGSSEFARPGQELVTEWCWGHVWTRPGLDRKQRSLLNLGMLIALKAWPELAVHTRGAINNGLTEREISEAVLQATIYCGAPAGIEATKVTEKTINEMIETGEYTRA